MNKTFMRTSAALAAMTFALACQAAPTAAGSGAHAKGGLVASSGTLYNQNGTDSGIGIVSQNFESSFDIYDAAAADDFTVDARKWRKWIINEVDVVGVYFNGSGPAQSEHVTFYRDAGGHPGAAIHDYANVAGSDSGGSFNMKIPATKLLRGTYWLSVVANMDFSTGGEWGWENQTTVVGNPANWENPGDGFGTGCTTWEAETTCIPDGQGDHMFMLKGRKAFRF